MTRLVSLLVDKGVITRAQGAEAHDAQVLYGDRIGTNLLALGMLDESTLARGLGALHDVPYAAGRSADSHVAHTRALHRSVAEAFRVVPARVDDAGAFVFVLDPRDANLIAQVAHYMQRPVAPVVVCEARMQWLLHKFYLVRKGQRRVRLDDEDRTPRHRIRSRAETRPASVFTDDALLDDPTAPHALPVSQTLPSTASMPPVTASSSASLLPALPVPAVLASASLDRVSAVAYELSDAEIVEEELPAVVEEPPPIVQGVLEPPPRDESPLTFDAARPLLAAARNRNEIALAVLRFCLSLFSRAVLLTVDGDLAYGWDALGPGIADPKSISLPLSSPSIFKLARDSQAHFLGPLPKERVNILFLKLTGKQIPKSALVVPIVVRGRVVNLLYCDNGHGTQVTTDIGDMLVVAQHINRSYESLLRL